MTKLAKTIVLFALLTACGSVPQDLDAVSKKVSSLSTATLWSEQQYSSSPLAIAFAEAELGARGATHSGSSYLGKKTRSAYRKSLYARPGGGANAYNCSDFPSSAAAQKFFLASGGPLKDPNNFDADGDGLACEWGAQISRVAKTYAVKATPTRRYSSSRTCYTGPRGGTYTITSSGRKNYGGC